MLQRNQRALTAAACVIAFAITLAGCGGKNQSAPENTATLAPVASPLSESQRETRALPLAQVAPVPKSLHCSGAVVWANTARKTYHLESDPYYGRTAHGEYLCEDAAISQGYHKAGAMHHHRRGASNMMEASPEPAAT
jgi:hypothetical protein